MDWYWGVWRKYATFDGRARRQEYWMFFLVNLVVGIVLSIIDRVLGFRSSFGLLNGLYSLAIFLPSLAVAVRRLHDTDKSGWWVLIGLVPFVGWIIVLVFLILDGTHGPNRFGPDPKGGVAAWAPGAATATAYPGSTAYPSAPAYPAAPAYAGAPAAPAARQAAAPVAPLAPAVPASLAAPAAPAPVAPPQTPAAPPAGWYPDPSGRHQHRYWDDARWTEHVSDNGVASTDPV